MTDLGANKFTFTGHDTTITYLTQAPGPVHPGGEGDSLVYTGPEGSFPFAAPGIAHQDGPLGTELTVTLKLPGDTGGLTATLLLSPVEGVSQEKSVRFETLLIKATSRGNLVSPGPAHTYHVVHLHGEAEKVIQPLAAPSS